VQAKNGITIASSKLCYNDGRAENIELDLVRPIFLA